MFDRLRVLSDRVRAGAAIVLTAVAAAAITLGGAATHVRFGWYLGVAAVTAALVYLVVSPGRPASDGHDGPVPVREDVDPPAR